MKAISKRVLSLGLSLAMVASVIAVPSTEAQAATGIAKSKTYYVGQTKTLKLTTSSKWKNVKTTWSTSKKSIVKIAKKTNKTVTINCVKAGKANVTAKVSFKKGTKKYTKKYTCKVTVKNPTFKVSAGQTTLKLGETTAIKVTKKPSSAVVKYSSDDAAIAKISGGKITATGIGTTKINARMKIGNQTVARKSVEITVLPSEDGLTAKLTNPISDNAEYANVVWVNQKAVITVAYTKDGRPVAGETVVFVKNKTNPTTMDTSIEVASSSAVTNSNGIATFVVGVKNAAKATDATKVANVDYTLQIPGANEALNGEIRFASIGLHRVYNVNNADTDPTNNIVPGTNYQTSVSTNAYSNNYGGLAYTASMDKPWANHDEYVASQQVSVTGKANHKVIFAGGYPEITVYGNAGSLADAVRGQEEVTELVYNDYKTYESESQYHVLKVDPTKLTYATLDFDYLKLSKYTRVVVETYDTLEHAKLGGSLGRKDQQIYNGEQNQGAFGYQIPLEQSVPGICVKVTVQSAGQVDETKKAGEVLAQNAGYKASKISYVYKTSTNGGKTIAPLKDAKVNWSKAATKYSAEIDLDEYMTSIKGYKVNYPISIADQTFSVADGGKVTIKLPVFPQTGTAVITDYDQNNKVEQYFAVTTKNNLKNVNSLELVQRSGSIMVEDVPQPLTALNDFILSNTNLNCYMITGEELTDNVGEIIATDSESVTVDSEKSGRTNLVGSVEFGGKLLKLDAETDTVYTSIQWNPVPKGESSAEAFAALVGQTIEVVGQLIDQNGNAVTEKNIAINFTQGGNKINAGASTVVMADGANDTKATVVDITNNGKTDSMGQVKMILKSADFAAITSIKAETGDSRYDVKLRIEGKDVDRADLYWVDQDLKFVDTVVGTPKEVCTDNFNISVSSNQFGAVIEPKAGTNWMYGLKVKGQTIPTPREYGSLAGKTITIDKLAIQMSQGNGGVGTVDVNTGVNGMVKATSSKVGLTKIVGKLNSDSVVAGAVESDIYTYAGKGATSLNKRLTLGVTWKNDGITAEIVTPAGIRVAGSSTVVYAKVVDTIGNVISGNDVTFKAENGTFSESGNAEYTVKTDKNGIAVATLNQVGTNARSTVNVKVDGVSDNVFTKTYTWVTSPKTFAVDTTMDEDTEKYKAVFDKEARTVTLSFTDDIVDSSVVANAFEVYYGKDADDKVKLAVENATVKGEKLVLTLTNVPSTIDADAFIQVNIKTKEVKSVDYHMTSVDGVQFVGNVYFQLDGTAPVSGNKF